MNEMSRASVIADPHLYESNTEPFALSHPVKHVYQYHSFHLKKHTVFILFNAQPQISAHPGGFRKPCA